MICSTPCGKRSERFHGTANLPFFFRKPYGPGWALAGDAELVALAIDAGLSGRRPLDAALGHYERRRNEASMPLFELTCEFATLQPPGVEQQQLFAALRQDQEQTNRFFGTMAGTVPVAEFFAPHNLGQIIDAGAQVAGV